MITVCILINKQQSIIDDLFLERLSTFTFV